MSTLGGRWAASDAAVMVIAESSTWRTRATLLVPGCGSSANPRTDRENEEDRRKKCEGDS